MRRIAASLLLLQVVMLWTGCKREDRSLHVQPPAAQPIENLRLTTLIPGSHQTNQPVANPYEGNALAMSEGKRLYSQFNCVGCHSHGGGGMGPPLMDDTWIYGSNPDQIHATIIQGRPNGMPSFGGKITDQQAWQLAAYVRSLSGLASTTAANGRNDEMQYKQPENSVSKLHPKGTGPSPGEEMPQ